MAFDLMVNVRQASTKRARLWKPANSYLISDDERVVESVHCTLCSASSGSKTAERRSLSRCKLHKEEGSLHFTQSASHCDRLVFGFSQPLLRTSPALSPQALSAYANERHS